MKRQISQLLIASVFILIFSGCSKDTENANSEPQFQTGTFTGTLVNLPYGVSNTSFKVQLAKIGERKYSIKQITSSTLPEFVLTVNKAITPSDVQLEQSGYYKCTIPNQSTATGTVKGDGASTGEEDAAYFTGQKRLTFVIQINNSGVRVAYSGTKD